MMLTSENMAEKTLKGKAAHRNPAGLNRALSQAHRPALAAKSLLRDRNRNI